MHSPTDMILTGADEANVILLRDKTGQDLKHVLSIGTSLDSDPSDGYRWNKGNKLRLGFSDINCAENSLGYVGCTEEDVQAIIDWSEKIKQSPGKTLLHCAQGVSRSSAACLILCSVIEGAGREPEAVSRMVQIFEYSLYNNFRTESYIRPNSRMVELGDRMLHRQGALIHALKMNPFEPRNRDTA